MLQERSVDLSPAFEPARRVLAIDVWPA
jgi:hypothetical protein